MTKENIVLYRENCQINLNLCFAYKEKRSIIIPIGPYPYHGVTYEIRDIRPKEFRRFNPNYVYCPEEIATIKIVRNKYLEDEVFLLPKKKSFDGAHTLLTGFSFCNERRVPIITGFPLWQGIKKRTFKVRSEGWLGSIIIISDDENPAWIEFDNGATVHLSSVKKIEKK